MLQIAVISGKGGTGKTILSASFATSGSNITVADCDVDASNLYLILNPQNNITKRFITGHKAIISYDRCTYCGICIKNCRFDAIKEVNGTPEISETDCDGCFLCSRLCPASAIEMTPNDRSNWYLGTYRNGHMIHARLAPGEENSGKLVNVVREEAVNCAKNNGSDIIIIDGPPGTGCPAISAITGADIAVVVTEPSCSGLHDMKRILDVTAGFKIRSYVVINKYDLNSDMTDQIEQWCSTKGYKILEKLPFNNGVIEAMINSKSITEWDPNAEISIKISRLFRELTTF